MPRVTRLSDPALQVFVCCLWEAAEIGAKTSRAFYAYFSAASMRRPDTLDDGYRVFYVVGKPSQHAAPPELFLLHLSNLPPGVLFDSA